MKATRAPRAMDRRLHPSRFSSRTFPALLRDSCRRKPAGLFLTFMVPDSEEVREWTFGQFEGGVRQAVRCLQDQGVTQGDRVLLLADNSPEWQMLALATQILGAEPAGLFSSLGPTQAAGIAKRVQPRVVVVSSKEQWDKLQTVRAELQSEGLQTLICGTPLASEAIPSVPFDELFHSDAPGVSRDELDRLIDQITEDDPFLLLFTSGTTGHPKGVRLSQRAAVHAVEGGATATGTDESDVGLHLLPFGHVAGQDQFALALAQAHQLVMVASRKDLPRALNRGPTYMFAVPMVYERIRDAVYDKLSSLPGPLASLADYAMHGAQRVRVDGSRKAKDRGLARVADMLVGRSVKKKLGGRIQALFAGGAPSSEELFRFFEALNIPYVELYGLSETAGLVSSNLRSDAHRRPGVAGWISADHEVRFSEEGELQVRGPLLLSGFLEQEDQEGSLTEDGWFKTGDLAHLTDEGMLQIKGRAKNVLVLSTGKKIPPEPVEQAIASGPPFADAALLGEGRPFVTAAVFVPPEHLRSYEQNGQDVRASLLQVVHERLGPFSEYERPKRLTILKGTLTDYPDLLTPTYKLKRAALAQYLGPKLDALYA